MTLTLALLVLLALAVSFVTGMFCMARSLYCAGRVLPSWTDTDSPQEST